MSMCCFYLCNCKAQIKTNTCEQYYLNAKAQMNEYSKTADANYLSEAQKALDSSLSCNKIRKKVIERKIQNFILQEKYTEGAKFIDTLNIADFDLPYQKQMYINYLEGKNYESLRDKHKRDSVYKYSMSEIEKYIDIQHYKSFPLDSTVYYNLYFVKSRIYDSNLINKDIDSLKLKFPNDKTAIERLRNITLQSID